jgi:Protein of unknown function (DUF3037)
MNNIPCLYAIVRFAPFVETGEFANAGVILLAPTERFFDFKLMSKKHARVTSFFEPLEGKVFRATMHTLEDELKRASGLFRQHGFDKRFKNNDIEFVKGLFNEIIRPRETTIKFSEPRPILTADPKAKLDDLYAHYVERGFVTREYQEAALEKGMRKWLGQARIGERFARVEVGNQEYRATFPFVEKQDDLVLKAIKPLHLNQPAPNKILDHGGQWLFRLQALKKRGLLPERVLFAVNGPTQNDPRGGAVREIVDSLEDIGVTVLPYSQKQQILEFATAR